MFVQFLAHGLKAWWRRPLKGAYLEYGPGENCCSSPRWSPSNWQHQVVPLSRDVAACLCDLCVASQGSVLRRTLYLGTSLQNYFKILSSFWSKGPLESPQRGLSPAHRGTCVSSAQPQVFSSLLDVLWWTAVQIMRWWIHYFPFAAEEWFPDSASKWLQGILPVTAN